MTVHTLPTPPQDPIAQFIRLGSDYHQMDELLAAGRLPVDRAVFRAALVPQQRSLANAIRAEGREIVLDTGVADLTHPWRYKTGARGVTWANDGRPLAIADTTEREFVRKIADFASQYSFHSVLSPTHYIENLDDGKFAADTTACTNLRAALDGHNASIGIDYQLSISHALFSDPSQRRRIIKQIADLPVRSIWLRISPFGITSSAAIVRRYAEMLVDFNDTGLPLIVDGIAGFPALALLAFGAASGIAHGVSQNESFRAQGPVEPRRKKGQGGSLPLRALIPALDCQLTRAEYDQVVGAHGGRRAISCTDRGCCPRGVTDTWASPKAHYLRQRRLQMEGLAAIPNAHRQQHFLEVELPQAERRAREISRLRLADVKLKEKLVAHTVRIEKFYRVFEDLQESGHMVARSRPLPLRRDGPPGLQGIR